MAEYVYTPKTPNLKEFIEKIHELGIPDKLTRTKLEALGYKSKNDRPIIAILKALDFLGSDGVPTDIWRQYRDKSKSKTIMAQAVRKYYADLFKLYPNAYQKDTEALTNFFRSHTSVGDQALSQMVKTFQALAELSEFEETTTPETPPVDIADPIVAEKVTPVVYSNGQPVIHLNIQLTLPEGADAKTFEDFFKAMKKHLLN